MIGIDYEVQKLLVEMREVGLDLRPYEIMALSRFVKRLRYFGVWSKFIEIYPLAGPSKETALYKLKYLTGYGRSLTVSNGTLSDNQYSSRTGVKGDGATLLSTGIYTQYAFASHTDGAMFLSYDMGFGYDPNITEYVWGNGVDSNNFSWSIDASYVKVRHNGSNATLIADGGVQQGVYAANRLGTDRIYVYKGAAEAGYYDIAAVGLSNGNTIKLLGRHVGQQSNAYLHFSAIGEGFSATDMINAQTAIVQLLKDLRRPVYV